MVGCTGRYSAVQLESIGTFFSVGKTPSEVRLIWPASPSMPLIASTSPGATRSFVARLTFWNLAAFCFSDRPCAASDSASCGTTTVGGGPVSTTVGSATHASPLNLPSTTARQYDGLSRALSGDAEQLHVGELGGGRGVPGQHLLAQR